MKKFKTFAVILAFVLCMALTAGVTVALLKDTDEAVNVMTVGNVYIEQMEYERIPDANGVPTDDLQEFTQNKPWIPVTEVVGWDNGPYQTWEDVGAPGANQLFDRSVEGVLDKFVFVKNTGSTNAYYRTIVAIECPEGLDPKLIHVNNTSYSAFDKSNTFYTEIGGVQYWVQEYIYTNELKPGEVSRPSLLQLYLDMEAENEDVALFGGQLDVLVVSQAVQASGFDTAKEGLDAAFGPITETSHPWISTSTPVDGVLALNNEFVVLDGYTEALTISGSGTVLLKNADITAETGSALTIAEGANVKLNIGSDSTLVGTEGGNGIYVAKDAELELTGAGSLTAVGNGGVDDENGGSGIGGEGTIYIHDLTDLTAEGYGEHGFGIGGASESITIEDTHITYVKGGYVQPEMLSDPKYGKSEPEGGAAVGSSTDGAVITLNGVTIEKADGGSKAAGIGASYWTGVTINITDCTIKAVNGGNASAGIGGSRVHNEEAAEQDVIINIVDSTITANGGQFAAGIGSGYDTYCHTPDEAPMCTINIKGDSVISATGGKYAAGIGTGYHAGGLDGVIEDTVTVTAASGEKFYKDSYTQAQDIGFGVIDPARDGLNNTNSINYKGTEIGVPEV